MGVDDHETPPSYTFDLSDHALDDVTHQLSATRSAKLGPLSSAVRWIILLFFGFALIGGLAVHMIQAKYSLIVYTDGARVWSPGRAVALRVKAFSEDRHQTLTLQRARVSLIGVRGVKRGVVKTWSLERAPHNVWQGVVHAPTTPGVYRLKVYAESLKRSSRVEADHDASPKERPQVIRLGADTQIEVKSSTLEPSVLEPSVATSATPNNTSSDPLVSSGLKLAATPLTASARRGLGALSLFAAEQQTTLNLSTEAFVVAQDSEGAPWRGEVRLSMGSGYFTEPLPRALETDASGIGTFQVGLQSFQGEVEARASIEERDTDVRHVRLSPRVNTELMITETVTREQFTPRAHTINLSVAPQLGQARERVTLNITSSLKRAGLYVDLWWSDRWIATRALNLHPSPPLGKDHRRHAGQMSLLIPDLYNNEQTRPQLVWVQASRAARLVDESRGGAYIVWTPPHFTRERTAAWLRALLIELKVEPYRYWERLSVDQLLAPTTLRLALGRIARPKARAQIFINSGESARETARLQRAHYFKVYLNVISALGVIVFLWIGGLIISQYRSFVRSYELIDARSLSVARRTMWIRLMQVLIFVITFFGLMLLIPSLIG